FSCSTAVRAASDTFSLLLAARHNLVSDSPSDTYLRTKGRLPEGVDVLLCSNLVVSVSGFTDRAKVSSEDILKSGISANLLRYFRLNAKQLGVNAVSDMYIDEDGLAKFTLSPMRTLRAETPRKHTRLVSIDLTYTWRALFQQSTTSRSSTPQDDVAHPFSSRLLLPLETILNRVVEKFVSWQLVRPYPLIFGPWCKRLDEDLPMLLSIASSISSIVDRSTSTEYRTGCQKLINGIKRNMRAHASASSHKLSEHLATSLADDALAMTQDYDELDFTNEEAIVAGMERVFQNGLSKLRFKGVPLGGPTDSDADDERGFDLSQEQSQESQTDDLYESELIWDHPVPHIYAPTHDDLPPPDDDFWDLDSNEGSYWGTSQHAGLNARRVDSLHDDGLGPLATLPLTSSLHSPTRAASPDAFDLSDCADPFITLAPQDHPVVDLAEFDMDDADADWSQDDEENYNAASQLYSQIKPCARADPLSQDPALILSADEDGHANLDYGDSGDGTSDSDLIFDFAQDEVSGSLDDVTDTSMTDTSHGDMLTTTCAEDLRHDVFDDPNSDRPSPCIDAQALQDEQPFDALFLD
ncbi:hypothetical protein PLICRDRAFT_264067, partial [Plicaturopsis crispa FD-325 SS-3]